jgi:hypothetical protein
VADRQVAPSDSLDHKVPRSYTEALRGPDRAHWAKANQEEIDALWANGTFEWATLPPDATPIDTKYTYRIKTDMHGRIARWKSRLVARGDQQRWVRLNDQDNDDDNAEDNYYSPTAQVEVVRAVLQTAVMLDYEINLVDISNAYLKAHMQKKVYLRVPHGFAIPDGMDPKTTVLLVVKSLYGMRESALLWNTKLHGWLVQMGFERLKVDPCVRVYRHPITGAIIGVYVDDLIIATRTAKQYHEIVAQLRRRTELTETRNPRKILGMEVRYNRRKGELALSSCQRIVDLVAQYNLLSARTVATPTVSGEHLQEPSDEEARRANKLPYRQLLGSLSYLATTTRPDIAFAVNTLARYNKAWAEEHWHAAKRIVRYLYGTATRELVLRRNVKRRIVIFADASFSTGSTKRVSVTGYAVGLETEDGDFTPIAWKSKRQTFVAQSTAEAEAEAIASSATVAQCIELLFAELHVKLDEHPLVRTDSTAAESILGNPFVSARTRHLAVRYAKLREIIADKHLVLTHVDTKRNTSDVFTKALDGPLHTRHCDAMMRDPPPDDDDDATAGVLVSSSNQKCGDVPSGRDIVAASAQLL